MTSKGWEKGRWLDDWAWWRLHEKDKREKERIEKFRDEPFTDHHPPLGEEHRLPVIKMHISKDIGNPRFV